MQEQYILGIDVGSTTLKTVVLDPSGQIVEKSYQRHLSKVRETTYEHIKSLQRLLKGQSLKVAITGSAGMGLAESGGLCFVQEVFATADAVAREHPDADVVIELGGEDAKIIFLQGTLEERMNGTCAGGTGSFIDQMAALMNVTLPELDALSLQYEKIYPIASRCGVFAKSDIQPLLNQGARKEDLAASIFQAVVDQTIGGLAQGRDIAGNVLFLGGPLSFFKGLQERFVETLKLSQEQANFTELAPYFMALGAAYYAKNASGVIGYEDLVETLACEPEGQSDFSVGQALFKSDEEYQVFKQRHAAMTVEQKNILTYSGNAYLGIDAGSTTTKLVLIAEDDSILYRHYASNGGNPLPVIREQLMKIYKLCGERINIAASAVTGYGEELMQAAFGIDFGLVETVAHYTAAKHFSPDVNFIIDIGGQDIKCFHIKDGAVDSVVLNEACSSGCGSFIETFATSLGYSMDDFSALALTAERPVDLGSRCTVFMNSSLKQAQKDGASVADIAAGLAMSVIKNALYKVIRVRSGDELGEHIVVQGGTFLNDAILRCFERELGREVVRLSISELMGAYGAALYAKANTTVAPRLIDAGQLAAFTHKSTGVTCKQCTNKCAVTVSTFGGDKKFIVGNKCDAGAGGVRVSPLPNLVAQKYEALMDVPLVGQSKLRVGIPMVLNMYENLPFWAAFFTELGCDIVLSEQSSRDLYMKGQHTIPSDTACYPAKIVHGHIESLVSQSVDAIFYPCMSYNVDEGISDNCYNCPVVAYYPEVIAGNVASVAETKFIYSHIGWQSKSRFIKQMEQALKAILPLVKRKDIAVAADKAYAAHTAYRKQVADMGQAALDYAKENNNPVILLGCRPYHIDPEINHGIDTLLSSLGFVIVTEDAIGHLLPKPELNILNQWTYHARLYNAAKFVAQHDNMEMVLLVSFGCGLDAITGDEISDILRNQGKLYTQIKIDEINNLGAAKIRLRSLASVMKEREA
ncbi:MAG: acyl-CoA dehydratase activase [Oscillospiraceae bacterium]|nr:acyl-CoA dehydratase activase [Oscillospiraceae bacterium]